MTADLKLQIHSALKLLAGQCDGAHEKDDCGFNITHTTLGRQLANREELSDWDAFQGLEIVKHYRRQLGAQLDTIESLEFEEVLETGGGTPPTPPNPYRVTGVDSGRIELPPPPAEAGNPNPGPPASGLVSVPTPTPTPTPTGIQLTAEQTEASELIFSFMSDDPREEFKLGGFAGSGKTTLIKYIIKELSKQYNIAVMAFTGKAVHVLQKKGIPATTIHSRCYDVIEDPETHEVTFERKITMADDPDLIIVDEASMISSELYQTLKSYGKKYLFVGDPGQLEPVGDNPNLMRNPDFTLTKVHRQAEQSPIISFATTIRQGGAVVYQEREGLIVRRKQITSPEFLSCDQIICAKNVTRKDFNNRIRAFLKHPLRDITEGEKLICLRNNSKFGVFNGMIFKVAKIKSCNGFRWDTECIDELGKKWFLPIWCDPFRDSTFDEKKARIPKEVVYCDYGYCITCHKSQGSEWNKVLIWDEWMPAHIWDMKRWRYTAITRAAKELIFNV